MKFISLSPFIPSGKDFEGSKRLFQELGFSITWDAGGYVGFASEGCQFILQQYDNEEFAQNLMINVKISDAAAFYQGLIDKKLTEKFSIRISKPTNQPYGIEVNVIDLAGVCWHFVQ